MVDHPMESITVQLLPSPNPVRSPLFRDTAGWKLRVCMLGLCVIGSYAPTAFLFALGFATLLWLSWNTIAARRDARDMDMPGPAATYEDSERLVCIGDKEELDALRDLDTEFFEPYIVMSSRLEQTGSLVCRTSRWLWVEHIAAIGLFAGLRFMGYSLAWSMGFMLLLYLVLEFIFQQAFGVYYRISPGRLDVLSSRLLPPDMALRKAICLRTAKIRCFYDCGFVVIYTEHGDKEIIQLSCFSNQSAFVRMLFMAAVSPHTAPLLPSERLLG